MILIVDDKPENIYSLKRILETNGFEVDTADSGEVALKKILKTAYSLVILDVQMPGMDGFEVAETVSGYSNTKDIPIIFLSAANTEKKFIKKGYLSGGMDYITKPVDPDILLLRVNTLNKLFKQTRELNKMQHKLMQEIETRKHAQKEQKKKTQELQSILESIPQIAFTASKEGHIEYVNRNWYKFSDQKDKFPETHEDDQPVEQKWKKILTKTVPASLEVRLKHPEQKDSRYYLLNVIPVKQNEAILKWIGTFTDINEQKSANELLEQRVRERTKELQSSNHQLEARNHDLQQFASVASHDLKEPLRKIQIFSSIIKEKNNQIEVDGISYIDRIINSAERMSRLIDDLLNYSGLSVASFFHRTDINEIIKGILDDLEILINEKKAIITVKLIPVIEAIPGQIRQIFQNIISNALKFSKKDVQPVINISAERTDTLSVESPAADTGNYCRIYIKDTGIGFNEAYIDKIFTIFQRLNTPEEYEGTGIGLAITKKIVDKHNGIITAKSKKNEGSTFIIVLPVHQKSNADS